MRILSPLSFAVFFLAFSPYAVAGEFYKYKDEKGIVHLSNDISSIPEKFRDDVKIIKEDSLVHEEKNQSVNKDVIVKNAEELIATGRLEAEKFWWRWIVDPKSGAAKTPAIIGGYLAAAAGTLVFMRRHMRGRLYKVTLKALLLGFALILILTWSAHRGYRVYEQLKKIPAGEFAGGVLKKGR